VLEENPLADFVELPEHLQDLRSCVSTPPLLRIPHSWRRYSNIYCGVIKGALEMVNIRFATSASCLPPPQLPQPWRVTRLGCRVNCTIMKDPLCGDDAFELKLVSGGCARECCGLCVTPRACSCGAAGGQVPVQGRLMISAIKQGLYVNAVVNAACCPLGIPHFHINLLPQQKLQQLFTNANYR
jgi:hypothetical protein